MIVGRAFDELGVDTGQLGNQLADTFTVRREELVRPYEGAMEAVREFRQR